MRRGGCGLGYRSCAAPRGDGIYPVAAWGGWRDDAESAHERRRPDQEQLKRRSELASHVVRFWWSGIIRGGIALVLGLSALLARGSPERLATFLALYGSPVAW